MTALLGSAGKLWRSRWFKPLNDLEALDDFVGLLNPAWSLRTIRARVVAVAAETPDIRSFRLRPNGRWRGFAAGQHVVITVEIDGVRHHRTFSISSAPTGRDFTITVKRQGKVTRWMHEHLRPGGVITVSPAAGEFTLPATLPERLLFVSAGSGITPVMSLLRQLAARDHRGAIAFVHGCRTPDDLAFAAELHRIAQTMTDMQLHLHFSAESGRLTVDRVTRQVPDWAERETYLCGPRPFMAAMRAHWDAHGAPARLHAENFGVAPVRVADGGSVVVRAARAARTFAAAGGPLLAEAEAAGLAPKHGCRIGICQSCKCVKQSGTVQNLLTGALSSEPGQLIQLCISAARSDLVLDI